MTGWALDLGTTNSGVALWDEALGRPRLIELPAICRKPKSEDTEDPLEAPRLVPSAVHFLEKIGPLDRLGNWPLLARRFFIGQRALIGRPALERNDGVVHPSFVPTFKPGLSSESLRPLARVGRESLTARDAAHAFLRELLREVKRVAGHRVHDLVVTSPVTAFETYRAEVQQVLRQLGVRRVRFIDEPVAAAALLARPQAPPGHTSGDRRDPIPSPGCLARSTVVGWSRSGPVVVGASRGRPTLACH
jgi:molecular chaperone DnaK (HSP70)